MSDVSAVTDARANADFGSLARRAAAIAASVADKQPVLALLIAALADTVQSLAAWVATLEVRVAESGMVRVGPAADDEAADPNTLAPLLLSPEAVAGLQQVVADMRAAGEALRPQAATAGQEAQQYVSSQFEHRGGQ